MESLTEIIVALLKNSLDANCTSIAIRICLELFWIQILDNGDGISREDLQSIGKCCLLNIDHARKKPSKRFARLTGETLLNVIGLCEEVLIESVDSKATTTNDDAKSHSRLFKHQRPTTLTTNEGGGTQRRNFEALSQYQHARRSRGTTVTLKNVFWQDVERQQTRTIKEERQTLLVQLRALALVHFDRSFTVQDLADSEVIFKSKRSTAFLPKYCELYHLSETDIDVTTCRKDNVLIECYFSERRIGHPLSPIELTFVNGLPSSELMPTANAILTQEKQNIDFVIVVAFPQHDVLTQLNEPIVKNCLLRCLNQYRECLERRKQKQHSISRPASGNSHQGMLEGDFGDVKFQHHPDEEDVLYGLSQPRDDRQTTFDKCSKWLKTNDFDVTGDVSPIPKTDGRMAPAKPHAGNGEGRKINFFDLGGKHPGAVKDNARKVKPGPQYKPTTNLPVPKFYPAGAKTNTKAEKLRKVNKPPHSKKEFCITDRPPEKVSFLNMATEMNVSKITMAIEETPASVKKLQQFAKKEKKKLILSPVEAIPHPRTPESFAPKQEELTFFDELEKSRHYGNVTSLPNERPSPIASENCFQATPQVERIVERRRVKSTSRQSFEQFPSRGRVSEAKPFHGGTEIDEPWNRSTDSITPISHAFAEPLFLEPPPEPEDTFNTSSPPARFNAGFDLTQSYREFHNACRETIQHFRVAIEPLGRSSSDEDDDEEEACCNAHQFNREIEKLRQPFHEPRNIHAKVGARNQTAGVEARR